jgi:hypothetical protein
MPKSRQLLQKCTGEVPVTHAWILASDVTLRGGDYKDVAPAANPYNQYKNGAAT